MRTKDNENDDRIPYVFGYNAKTAKHTKRKKPLMKRLKGYWNWRIETPLYYVYRFNYSVFKKHFTIGKTRLRYFIDRYNAVRTERVVEIPFAIYELLRQPHSEVLEVGNVLSHYHQFNHDIVDKYELGEGIINSDIVEYRPDRKYDLILSISTIEHIGFDEPVQEKGKAEKAMARIIDLLKPEGTAVITVPLAYNPEIDEIIKNKKFDFLEAHFMKRISRFNLWRETSLDDALIRTYGSRYVYANAIALLIVKKPAE
jgi:SAM-dependent methyltransferase